MTSSFRRTALLFAVTGFAIAALFVFQLPAGDVVPPVEAAAEATPPECTGRRFISHTASGDVPPAGKYLGSASCASATCHGGPIRDEASWNSSLTLWQAHDPHAGAGRLLYDDDSRRMVELLDPSIDSDAAYDRLLRRRCIACHVTATPEDTVSQEPLDARLIHEGVSCESCHGPSADWLESHLQKDWSRQGSSTSEPGDGHALMRDTRSIVGTAETCARCHVGSRSEDGLVRDMNHDLIAAGHPPLRFDLMTFLLNLPPHWDADAAGRQELFSSHIRLRDIGRKMSLAAAAMLAAERAEAVLEDPAVPWPELSDYDCFACHQSLTPKSYRLPGRTEKDPWLAVSDGLPMWNGWHARQLVGLSVEHLRRLAPGAVAPDELARSARQLAERFRAAASAAQAEPPPDPQERIRETVESLRESTPRDWHWAAVWFLDLQAAVADLARDERNAVIAEAYRRAIDEQVAPLLRFPEDPSWPDARPLSPRGYDGVEFRRATLEALDTALDREP